MCIRDRFYDATEGQVLVDGVDVREYTLASLHQKLGYVPQRAVMFSGTITSNVGYGADHATEAQVKQAVQIAQAADFVDSVGYAGPVAQGGANLSGGQKQRLAAAASMVCGKELLIFDEPTSGLDYDSMVRLSTLIRRLSGMGKIIFIVTHDYEFVCRTCTRVLHLDDGRIQDDFPVTEELLPTMKKIFDVR